MVFFTSVETGDDGGFYVDEQRLRKKILGVRGAATIHYAREVLTQMKEQANAYWGKAAVAESTRAERRDAMELIKNCVSVEFNSEGRNILRGDRAKGCKDEDIDIAVGDLVLVPFALGRGRVQAHAAACKAYKDRLHDVLEWSPMPEQKKSMSKLHLSLGGHSKEFPNYHARGEKAPVQPIKVKHAPADIYDVSTNILEHLMDAHGRQLPHVPSKKQKMLKQMYHLSLCYYTHQVPLHMDDPYYEGPGHGIANLVCEGEGLYLLVSQLHGKAVARAVWLYPGDLICTNGNLRYAFVHGVFRLMPTKDSAAWIEDLTEENIHRARSIYNWR